MAETDLDLEDATVYVAATIPAHGVARRRSGEAVKQIAVALADQFLPDAAYVAAMDPQTTLRLVAKLRADRVARETAVDEVARWQQAYEEQAARHDAERAELHAARRVVSAATAYRVASGDSRAEEWVRLADTLAA